MDRSSRRRRSRSANARSSSEPNQAFTPKVGRAAPPVSVLFQQNNPDALLAAAAYDSLRLFVEAAWPIVVPRSRFKRTGTLMPSANTSRLSRRCRSKTSWSTCRRASANRPSSPSCSPPGSGPAIRRSGCSTAVTRKACRPGTRWRLVG